MNISKVNRIFGYSLCGIGIVKIIFTFMVFIQMGMNFSAIFTGGNITTGNYPLYSIIIGFVQLIVGFGSFIMAIINMKNDVGTIPWYLVGIGAMLLEIILPSIVYIFVVFAACGMYVKAGSKIIKICGGNDSKHKTSKQLAKNTEWFYGEKEQSKNVQTTEKKEKQRMIIILVLIAIILIGIGIFFYNIIENYILKNEKTQIQMAVTDNEEKNNTIEKEDDNTDENIAILNQIADTFNNSNFAQRAKEEDVVIGAMVSENKIVIVYGAYGIEFVLEDNILTSKFPYAQRYAVITEIKFILALSLIDCVGQIKGYPYLSLYNALLGENGLNYTIENNGVEMNLSPDGQNAYFSIDLNSNLSF